MILRHRLFLLFMSFFVLVTNIGLNVFIHSCEEDGAFVSYVLPSNDHCGEEKEIAVLPSCCQKEAPTCSTLLPEMDNEDCCTDEFNWIKLSVDQDQTPTNNEPKIIEQFYQPFSIGLSYTPVLAINQLIERVVDPPPSLIGREILIKNQVFRI